MALYYLKILLTCLPFVNKCDLYNYADDNTLSKSDNTLETVIESLEEDSISNIGKKAARQLNFLKRIGSNLSRLVKLTIYHSFILSNLSYCPLTWHFCTEKYTQKNRKNTRTCTSLKYMKTTPTRTIIYWNNLNYHL